MHVHRWASPFIKDVGVDDVMFLTFACRLEPTSVGELATAPFDTLHSIHVFFTGTHPRVTITVYLALP